MSNVTFDPLQWYASYPREVIARPGYPARAAFKSSLMFALYGRRLLQELNQITTYADIGGCFGFGANSMAFHISRKQGAAPKTVVFEISADFIHVGRMLFPDIEFVEGEFGHCDEAPVVFDLVTLFDVVEHVVDPGPFLHRVAARSRYAMLITPMETSGEWRGNRPPARQGANHEDGHVNFFHPAAYEALLKASSLEIVDARVIRTIVPSGAWMALCPEQRKPVGLLDLLRRPRKLLRSLGRPKDLMRMILECPLVPDGIARKALGGGNHICLCRSRLLNS